MDGKPDQCTASSEKKNKTTLQYHVQEGKENLYDVCTYVKEKEPKGLARVCLCKTYCLKQELFFKEDTVTNETYKQIKNSDSFQYIRFILALRLANLMNLCLT